MVQSPSALCDWGVYKEIGATISLNQSFRNFLFLIIRTGSENFYNAGSTGQKYHFYPTNLISLANDSVLEISYHYKIDNMCLNLQATDSYTLTITGSNDTSKAMIRQVYG